MELELNIAIVAVVTLAAGYLMLVAGLQKSALEWKRRRRVCPSCGRNVETRVCSSCCSQ
jgi:hypothetical protein